MRQRQHLLTTLVIQDRSILLLLLFILLLGLGQGAKLIVPVSLQCVGHQPVVRIDLHEAVAGQFRFISGAFHLLPPWLVHFVQPGLQFRLYGEGQLQRDRLDHLQQEFPDALIDVAAGNLLADIPAVFATFMLARVIDHQLLVTFVIAQAHPPAADAADHKALEQGRALAGRTVAAVLSAGLGRGVQRLEVVLILRPTDVSGMGVGDQRMPVLLRHRLDRISPIGSLAGLHLLAVPPHGTASVRASAKVQSAACR